MQAGDRHLLVDELHPVGLHLPTVEARGERYGGGPGGGFQEVAAGEFHHWRPDSYRERLHFAAAAGGSIVLALLPFKKAVGTKYLLATRHQTFQSAVALQGGGEVADGELLVRYREHFVVDGAKSEVRERLRFDDLTV